MLLFVFSFLCASCCFAGWELEGDEVCVAPMKPGEVAVCVESLATTNYPSFLTCGWKESGKKEREDFPEKYAKVYEKYKIGAEERGSFFPPLWVVKGIGNDRVVGFLRVGLSAYSLGGGRMREVRGDALERLADEEGVEILRQQLSVVLHNFVEQQDKANIKEAEAVLQTLPAAELKKRELYEMGRESLLRVTKEFESFFLPGNNQSRYERCALKVLRESTGNFVKNIDDVMHSNLVASGGTTFRTEKSAIRSALWPQYRPFTVLRNDKGNVAVEKPGERWLTGLLMTGLSVRDWLVPLDAGLEPCIAERLLSQEEWKREGLPSLLHLQEESRLHYTPFCVRLSFDGEALFTGAIFSRERTEAFKRKLRELCDPAAKMEAVVDFFGPAAGYVKALRDKEERVKSAGK